MIQHIAVTRLPVLWANASMSAGNENARPCGNGEQSWATAAKPPMLASLPMSPADPATITPEY